MGLEERGHGKIGSTKWLLHKQPSYISELMGQMPSHWLQWWSWPQYS